MNLDKSFINKLLSTALSGGADFAEIYGQERSSLGFEVEEDQIRSSSSAMTKGVGIRVIHDGIVAYAHTEDLEAESLISCAKTVSKIANTNNASFNLNLTNIKIGNHACVKTPPSSQSIQERAALALSCNAYARSLNPQLQKAISYYSDLEEKIIIANSNGIYVEDERSICRVGLTTILLDKNGKSRVGTYGGGNRAGLDVYQNQLTPQKIAKEAVRMASAQMGAKPAPSGQKQVVLGPGTSGVLLHEAVGHGLEADFIRKKTSLFADRVGQKVASELCTVIDDGTIADVRGSLNVDDEGCLTKKNILIENGILKGYMNDYLNSQLMNTKQTGNGRRQSFRHTPIPRMTTTLLAPGQDDPNDIIKSVSDGIYCRCFGGGQVDITNGNFVFEVSEGYLIENGKITAPIEGATLIGNGPDVLTKISKVGNDIKLDSGVYTCGKDGQSVPVGVGLPTVKIDEITVGGQ